MADGSVSWLEILTVGDCNLYLYYSAELIGKYIKYYVTAI